MRSFYCSNTISLPTNKSAGFTYIGLLILLVIIATIAGASLQLGAIMQRRAAEEELLKIGKEFRNALQSYANATPAGQKRYPTSLTQLLKDPRYPHTLRHLRKLYVDPLTGKDEWGIVEPEDGHGVLAVYSLSKDRPIKVGNFDVVWQGFDGSDSYQRWRFGVNLNPLPNKPVTPTTGNVNDSASPASGNIAEKPSMTQEMRNQLNQQDAVRPYEQP